MMILTEPFVCMKVGQGWRGDGGVARWGCYWCDFCLSNDKALVVWVYIGDYATTWWKALQFIFRPWEPLWTNLTSLQNVMGSFFHLKLVVVKSGINNSTEVDDRHEIMWRATVETQLFLTSIHSFLKLDLLKIFKDTSSTHFVWWWA